ncbi:MAG: hypothetical protein HYV09_38750 [Deltaproteobacteria bacterium]|nr:hypothetical protein [Deltaproteobacteria bacterium]
MAAGAVGVACGQQGGTSTKQQAPEPPTDKARQAVHGDGGIGDLFEIDDPANTINGSTPGDDWQNTIGEAAQGGTQTSSATRVTRLADGLSNTTIFTGGGSKDPEDVSKWKWKSNTGSVPDKDDIVNAYAAAYNDTNGDLIIYFGADRFATDGDAQMGFWFFRDDVHFVPTPSDSGESEDGTFSGHHLDGDLLVLANFLKGGAENHLQVFKWSCGTTNPALCGSTGTLVALTGEIVTTATRVCNPAAGTIPADAACVATNKTNSVRAYWPYQSKDGTSATEPTIPPLGFVEGGINATQLSGLHCVSSFAAETRASQSPTATLKDIAVGEFPTCSLSITKECLGTTLSTIPIDGGTAVVPQVSYRWVVCNGGVGTVNNVVVTDQLVGHDASVHDVGSLGGQQCFDAGVRTYIPGAVDDGGTNPCQASFTNSVSATGGPDASLSASASASCPLCPCNVGGGDAGTGG